MRFIYRVRKEDPQKRFRGYSFYGRKDHATEACKLQNTMLDEKTGDHYRAWIDKIEKVPNTCLVSILKWLNILSSDPYETTQNRDQSGPENKQGTD